jgi:hypothetical protein
MQNPTRIKLAKVRKGAKDFEASDKSLEDRQQMQQILDEYTTNGPTDAINKRSINMINRRLGPELGMKARITSGQPDECDAHRGEHIGATVEVAGCEFDISAYNYI